MDFRVTDTKTITTNSACDVCNAMFRPLILDDNGCPIPGCGGIVRSSGEHFLYVTVEFLQDERIIHHNDFVMQIAAQEQVYIGPELPDDGSVEPSPGDYELRDVDVRAIIVENIRSYITRASDKFATRPDARSMNLSEAALDIDPLGIRSKPEVVALIGQRETA